ncbi:MAG TPA: AsnC family transcriptional regulator [Acidimicrobiales bacterium]|nr:AsnC family transcriptional regulator [Acidimicrobiales bacterium]
MGPTTEVSVLDQRDRRLIAALQCDGRVPVERAAKVLGINARVIRQRLRQLRSSGVLTVRGRAAEPASPRVTLLRVRVLQGAIEQVADALAKRPGNPTVRVSATGDEVLARLPVDTGPVDGDGSAVTAVTGQVALRAFSRAQDWRYPALTEAERAALEAPPVDPAYMLDETDVRLLEALEPDARATAESLAASTGLAAATVRRRLSRLGAAGRLHGEVLIDPRALGLTVEATLFLRVEGARLDEVGRRLAAHPAVHAAMATTGPTNLQVDVWAEDLDALYRLVTEIEADVVDTVLLGAASFPLSG